MTLERVDLALNFAAVIAAWTMRVFVIILMNPSTESKATITTQMYLVNILLKIS